VDGRSAVRTLPASVLAAVTVVAMAGACWRLVREPLSVVARPLAAGGPAAVAALPLQDLVSGACALALLGCAVRVLLGATLVLAAEVLSAVAPGGRARAVCAAAAERTCPRLARAALVGLLGAGVGMTAGGAGGAALADPPASPDAPSLDGLPLPDRPVGTAPVPPARRPAALAGPRVVRVERGDSLWSLTAALLPPHASNARVAGAWPRLYAANRTRVGGDPDLLRPGTRLVVPDLQPHLEPQPHVDHDLAAPDREDQP
jgi:hypothetical protein